MTIVLPLTREWIEIQRYVYAALSAEVLPLTREWIEIACTHKIGTCSSPFSLSRGSGLKLILGAAMSSIRRFSLSRGSGLKFAKLGTLDSDNDSSPSHEGVD